jgi:hypothetical protein
MNELQGAHLRRERAREHLPNLEVLVQTIIEQCENGVLAYEDPEAGEWKPAPGVLDPMRMRAGVIAGEILYNLRAALDYLVYVLAENDSGAPQSGTQFLIEDTQQGFTARSKRLLKGLSEEHTAIIRQFQPFRGCGWTGVLRDLSNADKHRELATVHLQFNPSGARVLTDYTFEIGPDAEGNPPQENMDMYLKGPAFVLLPEGPPLVDTMRHLETQVGAVLSIFAYEFPSF